MAKQARRNAEFWKLKTNLEEYSLNVMDKTREVVVGFAGMGLNANLQTFTETTNKIIATYLKVVEGKDLPLEMILGYRTSQEKEGGQ